MRNVANGSCRCPLGVVASRLASRLDLLPVPHRDDRDKAAFSITMNQQQGQTGSTGSNVNFLPPPRQEMEYLCAGKDLLLATIATVLNVGYGRLWREKCH
jgi:hypothetical protein